MGWNFELNLPIWRFLYTLTITSHAQTIFKLKYQTIHISFWCPKFLLLPLSWLIAECATCSNITERYFVFSHKFTNEYFSSKINRIEIKKRKLMNDRRGGAVLEQILLSLLWYLRKCSQNKINYSSPLFFSKCISLDKIFPKRLEKKTSEEPFSLSLI